MGLGEAYLYITDLQIPYEHKDALKFCKYLVKHYKIPKSNILCAGDEVDQYWGGMWQKSIEAEHTANQELTALRKQLRPWYKTFPDMRLCVSNHGTRYWRKALAAEIPSQLMRTYHEVLDVPNTWKYKHHWIIKGSKHDFLIEHGDDHNGQYPHIAAAMHNGISTALGHHHTNASIKFIKTKHQDIWGAVGGALIDFNTYAFDYAKKQKLIPPIGTLVIQ